MEYNIYVDVFFLLNLIVNFSLLLSCSWILKCHICLRRLFLAALIGSTLNTILLFAPITVWGGDFFLAVLMSLIAFEKKNKKEFLIQLLSLYLMAFATNGTIAYTHSLWGIVPLTMFSYLLGVQKKENENLIAVILSFHGKKKKLQGFYDTGNQLSDPVTGKMVHIVSYHAIKEILPKTYQEVAEYYFQTGYLENTKVTKMQMYEFTVLSYHSIGKETGQLLGIRMDSAVFLNHAGKKTEEKTLIGIVNQNIELKNQCRMIINGRLEL